MRSKHVGQKINKAVSKKIRKNSLFGLPIDPNPLSADTKVVLEKRLLAHWSPVSVG